MKRAQLEQESTTNCDIKSFDSMWIASYIIDKLYSRLNDVQYSHEIDNTIPEYVSQQGTNLIKSIAHLQISPCDNGESSGLDKPFHSWDISNEPPSNFI